MIKRAILSVSDKTGIVELARRLAAQGVTLLSTGGTMKAIADAGIPVTGVSDVTVRGTYELTLTITDTPPQTEPAVPAGGEDQTVPEVPET